MNHSLLDSIQQSDGRYLSDAELRPLAQFVASFDSRFRTYTRLKNEGEALVIKTLQPLTVTEHRAVIQAHGAKCQRDMLYTLECIAKAILLDNPDGFIEEYVVWMQNITRALHKESSAIDAYRSLQAEITATLPPEAAHLVNGYLDKLITAFAEGLYPPRQHRNNGRSGGRHTISSSSELMPGSGNREDYRTLAHSWFEADGLSL